MRCLRMKYRSGGTRGYSVGGGLVDSVCVCGNLESALLSQDKVETL